MHSAKEGHSILHGDAEPWQTSAPALLNPEGGGSGVTEWSWRGGTLRIMCLLYNLGTHRCIAHGRASSVLETQLVTVRTAAEWPDATAGSV